MTSVAFRLWGASSAAEDDACREDIASATSSRKESSKVNLAEAKFEATLAYTRNLHTATKCVPVCGGDLKSLQKVKAAAYRAYKYTWRECFVRFRACAGTRAFDYEPSVKVKTRARGISSSKRGSRTARSAFTNAETHFSRRRRECWRMVSLAFLLSLAGRHLRMPMQYPENL